MCGIIGILPLPVEKTNKAEACAREAAIRYLAANLLVLSVDRGSDATGLAVLFRNSQWMNIKQPVAAGEFSLNFGQTKYTDQDAKSNFKSFMDIWRRATEQMSPTSLCIGHVRKKTVGSEYTQTNNHPIIVNNIVGVHNGKVANDDKIFSKFKDMKRLGEVDSEAIFQLHNHFSPNGEITIDVLKKIYEELDGEYATLCFNKLVPGVVGGLCKGRPVKVGYVKDLELILVASEIKFIDAAIDSYNRMAYSLTGASLKAVTTATESIYIPEDGQAFTIDVRTPKNKVNGGYLISESVKKTTTVVASHATTHYGPGGYTHSTVVIDDASVEDLTDYTFKSEENSSSEESSSTVEGTIVIPATIVGKKTKSRLVKEAEEILHSRLTKKETWLTDLDAYSLVELVDEFKADLLGDDAETNKEIETTVTTMAENDLFSEFALHLIGTGYSSGFTEGYEAAGHTTKAGPLQGREGERWQSTGMKEKFSQFVANIKTVLMAALIQGRLVDVDYESRAIVFDTDLLDLAKTIHKGFDEDKFMKLFSNKTDVDTIEKHLDEEFDPDGDDEDDEAEGDCAMVMAVGE
jgi:hypothetical protein